MRRRLLAAGGALVLALVPFVALSSGTASAVAASAVGYWSKASAPGPLQPVLAPPNVPEGGVYVAKDPSGPASVATIRYPVTEAGGGQLVLKVAQASTIQTATLNICPVAAPWEPIENGPFDDQPANGCADLMINGSVSDDATSVSFFIPVTFPLNDGNLEIFIVAADSSMPFTVAFEAPGEESFVPAEGGGSEEFPGFEGGGDFGSGDGAGSDSGFGSDGDSGSGSSGGSFGGSTAGSGSSGSGFSAPTPSSGGSFTPSAGSSGSTGGAFSAPGTPGVTSPAASPTGGTAAGGASTGAETAAAPALTGAQGDPDDGTARAFAIGTLVAIGAGMFLLSARGGGVAALPPGGGRLATAPLAAGAAGGAVVPVVDRRRGVGRFARPRLGPPVRL